VFAGDRTRIIGGDGGQVFLITCRAKKEIEISGRYWIVKSAVVSGTKTQSAYSDHI
jgi:hypothetical protein